MDSNAIHPLVRENASSIMRLQHQSTGTPWTLKTTHGLLEDATIRGWGVQLKDTVLGFILIQMTGESADIVEFVVDEAYRHQGFGKKLYSSMEKYCIGYGLKEIFLEVSSRNLLGHLFYQKQGFRTIGLRQDYYTSPEGKADAFIMKKQLV
jgi:ribosomal-protein-alanine N-acetyltransferase